MKDADDVAAAASSALSAWASRAHSTHCLIADISRTQSSVDRKQLLGALSDSLSPQQRMDAVRQWLDVPSLAGLVWVCPEPRASRLHLHFRDLPHVVAALKEIPFVVRCGALAGNAWSSGGCVCGGVERHKLPEALLFSCSPSIPVPDGMEARESAVKALFTSMGLQVQTFWQSNRQYGLAAQRNLTSFSFYALPREADPAALVSLVNRVHRSPQHKLFGALVSVQGPNHPQLSRCSDCHALGHTQSGCNIFGGIPVRLLFKTPLAPVALKELMDHFGVSSAMLGNTHDASEWRPAHKATLFFNLDVTSAAAVERFQSQLQQLVKACSAAEHMQLQEPPRIVSMSFAARKMECADCGSTDKEHQCFVRGNTRPRAAAPPVSQRAQQRSASPPAASSAAASAQPGICPQWRAHKACTRDGCARLHPANWIPAAENMCRDFYHNGACKFENCKFTHKSSAEVQAAAAAAAHAPARATVAATNPQSKQQRARASAAAQAAATAPDIRSTNLFAALGSSGSAAAAAAAPPSPARGVPTSSLGQLSTPSRSNSQPNAAPAGGSGKKKKLARALDMGEKSTPAADASQGSAAAGLKRKRATDSSGGEQQQQHAAAPMDQTPQ